MTTFIVAAIAVAAIATAYVQTLRLHWLQAKFRDADFWDRVHEAKQDMSHAEYSEGHGWPFEPPAVGAGRMQRMFGTDY